MSKIDFLKKQVEQTGYPLEIEISSLLDGRWEKIINTDTYFDTEEKKLRDVDISANRIPKHTKRTYPLSASFNLIVECKRTEDFAWVFFSRPSEFEIEDVYGQYLDEIQIATRNTENGQIIETFFKKAPLHYRSLRTRSVCYDEFCIKGRKESYQKKRREIFEAQNQLKKYIGYSIEQTIKTTFPFEIYPMDVYFPCIVFDGEMYEAFVKDGGLRLKKSQHLLLRTLYRSPYSLYERSMLIDVVVKDNFEGYLDLIDEDIKSLNRLINKNSRKIVRKIDELKSVVDSAKVRA
jgi:hypothetical protein